MQSEIDKAAALGLPASMAPGWAGLAQVYTSADTLLLQIQVCYVLLKIAIFQ